jgi:hypothetical protein
MKEQMTDSKRLESVFLFSPVKNILGQFMCQTSELFDKMKIIKKGLFADFVGFIPDLGYFRVVRPSLVENLISKRASPQAAFRLPSYLRKATIF